ncbi:MAG: DUF6273 domain-containing protein [Selenomonadaceae bacterium]|nr:DUF6273 domain-containing protein [Selenomonadaceae bacterium]
MNIELNKAVVHFKMKFPETRIVKGILSDLFPEEGPEINLLTIVYGSGYVNKLVSMSQCTQKNIEAAVIAITKETFLAEAPVKEALTMWLKAYRELEEKKHAQSTPKTVQPNPDEAVKWLRKAAELGNQEAMLKLGTLLFNDKRSFSDIISDYEAIIHKHSEEINQWKKAYSTANNAVKENEAKYHQQLSIFSEQEYTAGYNDAKAGKRNKYTKEEPKLSVNPAYDFGNVKVGGIIKFGNYPQNDQCKKEPIEWRVLAVEGGKALLISQYALDCKKYNEELEDTSWEKCILRKWLNNDFMKSAFSDTEQKLILLSEVTADNNPKYDTDQGFDIDDKVFLLSAKEAEQYFKNDKDRKCIPTKFAVNNGAYQDEGQCWWWLRSLRSLGDYGSIAAFVNPDGSVGCLGDFVYLNDGSVRPALWINLKS